MRHEMAFVILAAAWAGVGLMPATAKNGASPGVTHQDSQEGKRVYQKANCVGCHKWHGDGGGGYGGDALSLRKTSLTRDQIIETIRCGRPGTGMPYHLRAAYDSSEKPCFGLTREDLPGKMPPEAAGYLRPSEMEAVADYVLAEIKGKTGVTQADCLAFFGETSRMCRIYENVTPQSAPDSGGTSDARPKAGH